jgi:hypothetical protein
MDAWRVDDSGGINNAGHRKNKTTEKRTMSIKELTYGYNVISEEVTKHMVSDELQVRTIILKKPRGRRAYILTIQESTDGNYRGHSLV